MRMSLNGYGLSLKRTQLLFSERYGYKKYFKLPFGWRLMVLKPTVPSTDWCEQTNNPDEIFEDFNRAVKQIKDSKSV